MKLLKTKLSVLALCTALMLPTAASAAAETKTADTAAVPSDSFRLIFSIAQTKVNGIYVPGFYITTKDSRVAFIPGGIGLVVVDKTTALPFGSYYLDK